MKKKLSAIVLVLFCFFPSFVKAESGIENFYVNAVLENDGDLVVEEYFYLNGEFNGMDRDILFRNPDAYEFRSELEYYGGSEIHNGSDIILEEIRALPIDENFTFQNISGTLFKKVSNASAGDYGVYTVTTSLDGESYRIFLPDHKNEAFYLKYTLKNMAVVHDDVAEIFWNVIGNDLRESIGTLKVTISFPNNKNEFRVWAHGPLQGEINKISNQVLEAQVKNVRSYKAVDIRAVFDKSVVPFSTKYTNVVALEKILNYEEDMANQANYEREQKEYQNQENAYAEISYCEERLSRSCYESAKRSVNLVTDLNVKADLQERLAELLVLIVAREEEDARNYTDSALLYRDYYWYEKAIEAVNILENKKLKETLLQQLESVRQEIMLVEEAYNKKAIWVNIFLFIVLGLLTIILYIKCDKEIKVDFSHKYMRDFPDDLAPSTVEYLFKKEISDKAVSSEILYLICQKKDFF